uniref:Myb-like domain-containing protein n=1 Tax=Macrostomum lignano TaxID=282301 RepID=A0A1I8FMK4_9PLAT
SPEAAREITLPPVYSDTNDWRADWQLQFAPAVSLYEPIRCCGWLPLATLPDSGLRALMLLRGRLALCSAGRGRRSAGIMYIIPTRLTLLDTRPCKPGLGLLSRHRSIRNSASKCANQRRTGSLAYHSSHCAAARLLAIRILTDDARPGASVRLKTSQQQQQQKGTGRGRGQRTRQMLINARTLAAKTREARRLARERRNRGRAAASSSENNLQHASFTSTVESSRRRLRELSMALAGAAPLSSRIWSAEEDTVLLFCHLAYPACPSGWLRLARTVRSRLGQSVCARFNLLFRGRRSFESLRRVRDSLLVRLRHSAAVRAWLVPAPGSLAPQSAQSPPLAGDKAWREPHFRRIVLGLLHRDEAVELLNLTPPMMQPDAEMLDESATAPKIDDNFADEASSAEEGSRRSCLMIGGLLSWAATKPLIESVSSRTRKPTWTLGRKLTLASREVINAYPVELAESALSRLCRYSELLGESPLVRAKHGDAMSVTSRRLKLRQGSSVACPPAVDAYFNGCAELNRSVLLGNQLLSESADVEVNGPVAALCAAACLDSSLLQYEWQWSLERLNFLTLGISSDLFNEAVGFVADAGIDDIGGASDNSRILRALLDCGSSSVGICTDGVCGLSPAELRRRLGLAADTCGLTDRCVQQRQLADLDAELMRLIEARAVFLVGYNMPYLVHRKHMRACLVNLNPRGLQQKLLVGNEKRQFCPHAHWYRTDLAHTIGPTSSSSPHPVLRTDFCLRPARIMVCRLACLSRKVSRPLAVVSSSLAPGRPGPTLVTGRSVQDCCSTLRQLGCPHSAICWCHQWLPLQLQQAAGSPAADKPCRKPAARAVGLTGAQLMALHAVADAVGAASAVSAVVKRRRRRRHRRRRETVGVGGGQGGNVGVATAGPAAAAGGASARRHCVVNHLLSDEMQPMQQLEC